MGAAVTPTTTVIRRRTRARLEGSKYKATSATTFMKINLDGSLFRTLDPAMRQRIARGAVWSIVGAGCASGLAMAANVICARFLGSTKFGELAIVLSTTNLFTTLFTSGLSMTASKYVAENRDTD